MNQVTGQFAQNVPRIMAMTTLAAVVAFAGSAGAAARDTGVAASPMQSANARLVQVARHKSKGPMAEEESAEARIAHLHDQLGITPAQEDLWSKVAVIMRENAEQITTLAKTRSENAKTMTAVDDLKSYAEIAGAHEDGTRKLIPAFKSLYDGMSGAQQKAADMVFREHGGHHQHHGTGHMAP